MDLSIAGVYPGSYLSTVWTDALTQNFTLISFTPGMDIMELLHKARPCSPIWLFLLLIRAEKECRKEKMLFVLKYLCDPVFDNGQSTTAFMMENRDLAASKKLWEQADFHQDVWKMIIMFHLDKVEVLSWVIKALVERNHWHYILKSYFDIVRYFHLLEFLLCLKFWLFVLM